MPQELFPGFGTPSAPVKPGPGPTLFPWLDEQPDVVVPTKPKQLSRTEVTSNLGKGLGAAVIEGLTDAPAGISALMWRRGVIQDLIRAVDPTLALSLDVAPTMNAEARKRGAAISAQMKTGAFSPETQAFLSSMGSLQAATKSGVPIGGSTLGFDLAAKHAVDLVAYGPRIVGNLIGSLPANFASYGAASVATGVGKATSLAGRVARSMSASTMATAAQSWLIQVADGESSWMRVVRDLAINAAFEAVGLSGLRKAWTQELGQASEKALSRAAAVTGISRDVAEVKFAQIRAGAGVTEPGLAAAIVKEGELNPKIAKTPIVFEAKKALDKYWNEVVPQNVIVNPKLGPTHGVTFDVIVDGKPAAQGFQIVSSKTDIRAFANRVDQVADRLVQLSQQGHSVRLDNITVSNAGAYVRFLRRLKGEPAQYGRMDARELTEFEKSLGQAAKPGTVAESGVKPQVGQKVIVQEPDRPRRVAVVADGPGTSTTVPVKDPVTNEVLDVPTQNVQTWLQVKRTPERYVAHSDGVNRHIYFELNEDNAWIEGVDAHEQLADNWFRTNTFSQVDREGGLINGPRGFVHEDGNLTLSLTRGARLTTYGGMIADSGALDLIDADRKLYKPLFRTPSERVAHNYGLGDDVAPGLGTETSTVLRKDTYRDTETGQLVSKFNAYGKTRPMRAHVAGASGQSTADFTWQRTPTGEWHKAYKQGVSKVDRTQPSPVEGQTPEPPQVTARMRAPSRKLLPEDFDYEDFDEIGDFDEGFRHFTRTVTDREPYPRYSIDKRPFVNDPNLIDAVRSARIMLDKKNMDPATKVRVVVTDTVHAGAHEGEFSWTLEELARAEPGLFPLEEVQAGATLRGYRAVPDGVGVTLIDVETGSNVRFAHRLEAANFLQKQRLIEAGPKLEADVNKLLGLGWMRSFDGLVDGGDFVPKEAQQVALNALVQNTRPLVKIWLPSAATTRAQETTIKKLKWKDPSKQPLEVKKQGWTEETLSEPEASTGLNASLRELERRLGVMAGTFRTQELNITQGNKRLVAVYNPASVQHILTSHGQAIENLLQVPVNTPERAVAALAEKQAGLEVLTTPDVESAIVYAHAKNSGNRELMLSGKPTADEVSGRTYRVFDDVTKQGVLKKAVPGQAVMSGGPMSGGPMSGIMPATPATPPLYNPMLGELDEQITLPPWFNFNGAVVHGPPPIMEPIPVPTSGKQTPPEMGFGLSNWFEPRATLFKKWERESKIPFYGEYLNLTQSKNDAVQEFAPMREALKTLRGRLGRTARTDIQLLFEARVSGNREVVAQMTARMNPKLVQKAEQLEYLWTKYLDRLGFNKEDMKAFFESFPQLRKVNGDFRAFAKMRPALPRMWSFIRQQMEQEATPLTLSERETDFFSLGSRVARMMTYERHLTPTFNSSMKKMTEYFDLVGVPAPIRGNFEAFANALMHTPDDLFMAGSETAKRVIRHTDRILRTMTFSKVGLPKQFTERDVIDLFGAVARLGYAGDLLYNTSTFLQQFLQLTQTIIPTLQEHSAGAFRYAIRWMEDPVLQADMRLKGVTNQELGMGEQVFGSGEEVSGLLAQSIGTVTRVGAKPMHFGDNFTRVAAYMGKHSAVMKYGERYISGKMTWQKFRTKVLLDLQDPADGPLTKSVREALDNGNVQQAAHRAAMDYQVLTNFNYSRGAGPRVLDGTIARFAGRYGTWPLSFGSAWKSIAMSGEKILTYNKLRAIATGTALNAGLMYGMAEAFGLDASKWSVWHAPLFRGGPAVEFGMDVIKVSSELLSGHWKLNSKGGVTFTRSTEANLAKTRLEHQFIGHMLMDVTGFSPKHTESNAGLRHLTMASAGFNHIHAAAAAAKEGDYQGALGALLGMPPKESAGGSWEDHVR